MEKNSKPQFVIDVENEKRFLENHCKDYCQICPDRLERLTSGKRCHCCFSGATCYINTNRVAYLNFYCILETGFPIGDKKIERSITSEELRQLYEVHEQV